MLVRSFVLGLSLVLAAGSAVARDLAPWYKDVLKQGSPNSLVYFVGWDNRCQFSRQDVEEMVEGVLIRARIKPILFVAGDGLYLDVKVNCLESNSNSALFSIAVAFGKFNPKPSVYYGDPSVGFGRQTPEGVLRFTKQLVEEAVTDYVSANFDL